MARARSLSRRYLFFLDELLHAEVGELRKNLEDLVRAELRELRGDLESKLDALLARA